MTVGDVDNLMQKRGVELFAYIHKNQLRLNLEDTM